MKRQIRNAIVSLAITASGGIGLMAFGQNPCCPQPCVQAVQPVVVQPVQQPAPQPVVQTVIQTVEQPAPQPCPQTVQCTQTTTIEEVPAAPVAQTTSCGVACEDLCDLTKRIEKSADHLRKDFKRAVKDGCLACEAETAYESVKEFERATDRLKKDFRRDCNSCDISGQVQEVLRLAECISAYIDPCSLDPETVSDWGELRNDLTALAGQFCTSVAFQQPRSLQPSCPVAQPAQFVQPVVQPVAVPVACPNGSGVAPAPVIIEKDNHDNNNNNNHYK